MGYKRIIESSLTKVFRQLKDLATKFTLTKVDTEFDFGADAAVESKTSSEATGVWLSEEKYSDQRKVSEGTLLLNHAEVGELDSFDTITDGTTVWTLRKPLKTNGFVNVVKVYRS
jgi:hypothetical protein